jgi:Holliday junction resolvase RusA-like endonuclease
MAELILELPYPPSLNSYYRHVGNKVLISKAGREYRERIKAIVSFDGIKGFDKVDLQVIITCYPPDNRRRDIDNTLKCLFDSLTHSQIWNDDSQVKRLFVEKKEPLENGQVILKIMEYQKNDFFLYSSLSQFFSKICR